MQRVCEVEEWSFLLRLKSSVIVVHYCIGLESSVRRLHQFETIDWTRIAAWSFSTLGSAWKNGFAWRRTHTNRNHYKLVKRILNVFSGTKYAQKNDTLWLTSTNALIDTNTNHRQFVNIEWTQLESTWLSLRII